MILRDVLLLLLITIFKNILAIQRANMDIIINHDIPKKDPSEDLLGYASFAKFVADNIILHHFDTGLVISLDAK